VTGRCQEGARKMLGGCQKGVRKGARNMSERCKKGARKVSEGREGWKGAKTLPGRYQNDVGRAPEWCRKGAGKVPERCQEGARKVPESCWKVPGRHQKGDRRVPERCREGARKMAEGRQKVGIFSSSFMRKFLEKLEEMATFKPNICLNGTDAFNPTRFL